MILIKLSIGIECRRLVRERQKHHAHQLHRAASVERSAAF
ncbi:hypothetical protein FHS49_002926 [Sphingobium boeckii]|uniref:Uncharacterized protein n=1 Tax=Sphingobium boeckii TaxID=1082345 RepID=A0A7W9AJL2_9SPHN|nr:hypothetical protein [Sphingobium boeckii]